MFGINIIISPLIALFSLSTGVGVLVHETKVDKLTSLAVMSSALAAKKVSAQGSALLKVMPHTHADGGVTQPAQDLKAKSPSVTPRRDKDGKYRLQKRVARGTHLFDSYHLPVDLVRGA